MVYSQFHINIKNDIKKNFGILCADKNDTLVQFSLPENDKNIIASKYELYLSSAEQLTDAVQEEIKKLEE